MWDLLNKEKLKEQFARIEELNNELSKTKDSLASEQQALTSKSLDYLSEKQRADQLQEKCDLQKRAIERLIEEFRAFIIQNKDNELVYDALEIVKDIPKEIANIKKYSIEVYIFSGSYQIMGDRRLQRLIKPYIEEFIDTTPLIGAIDSRSSYITQVSKYQYCLIYKAEFYSVFSLHKIQYAMLEGKYLSQVAYSEVQVDGSHLKVVGNR